MENEQYVEYVLLANGEIVRRRLPPAPLKPKVDIISWFIFSNLSNHQRVFLVVLMFTTPILVWTMSFYFHYLRLMVVFFFCASEHGWTYLFWTNLDAQVTVEEGLVLGLPLRLMCDQRYEVIGIPVFCLVKWVSVGICTTFWLLVHLLVYKLIKLAGDHYTEWKNELNVNYTEQMNDYRRRLQRRQF